MLTSYKPEIVIHTAALTNVETCETDPKFAYLQNVTSTKNLIQGCQKNECKPIFFSSSFVFDGKKSFYTENDLKNPINYYGKTKAHAEDLILSSELDYLILRTDQPYDWIENWQKDNGVTRVIKKLKAGLPYKEITNWYNNPTFIPDIAIATSNLICNDKTGIYHLVGSEFINRYSWSLIISEVFDLSSNLIIPTSAEQLNLKAIRPNTNLSNEKIEKEFGVKFTTPIDGLKLMRATYN